MPPASPLFPGKIRTEVFALHIAHDAFRDRGFVAIGVRDDPERCVAAVRTAENAESRAVDVVAFGGGVHRGFDVLEHRVAVVALEGLLECVAVSGAAGRIGEHDVIPETCEVLELLEERVAELRFWAAVNIQQRRMLVARLPADRG